MAKRVWYLKPGVAFKQFWADLNHVERRQYMAQRQVPVRWTWKFIDHTLEQIYSQTTISELIYRNNPFLAFPPSALVAQVVEDYVALAEFRSLLFLTGKEQ
jgi:hypothetical protein